MKKLTCYLCLILLSMFSMSFRTPPITAADLVGTKWVSPINDNCFDSLCFTSEQTVMVYRCEHNLYLEVGFKITDDKIEIQAFSKSDMDPDSKLILEADNGLLRQPNNQHNDFPENFVLVPNGVCN